MEVSRIHKNQGTSYSVLGARTMHVMRGRPEVAERHGAGHVPVVPSCGSWATWVYRGVRRVESPSTTRPRHLKGLFVFGGVVGGAYRLV